MYNYGDSLPLQSRLANMGGRCSDRLPPLRTLLVAMPVREYLCGRCFKKSHLRSPLQCHVSLHDRGPEAAGSSDR